MHYLCVQTLWWGDHWKQFCFAPVWLIKSCMWWNIGICSSDSKTEKNPKWPWPLHYVCRKMWQCGYTDLLELPVWSSRCWKLHGFIIISTYAQFRLFKVLHKNDTDQTNFQISVTWILAPNAHWPVTTFVWKGILEIVGGFSYNLSFIDIFRCAAKVVLNCSVISNMM